MIIVDSAIKVRLLSGRPDSGWHNGSDFMAGGMLIHVERYMRVLHVAAICNRNLERAIKGVPGCRCQLR